MTSVPSQIEALIAAEVERRTAAAIAELTAKREECDRLINKLAAAAVTSPDTASVTSTESPSPPTTKAAGGDGAIDYMAGAPSRQLEFIFNQLKPRSSGVIWTMLRCAWNEEPSRFEIGPPHSSAGDPRLHQTIFYQCPVHRSASIGGIGTYVVKVHVYFTTSSSGKQLYSEVTALTTIKHSNAELIASFC